MFVITMCVSSVEKARKHTNTYFFLCEFSSICWAKIKDWLDIRVRGEKVYQCFRWIDRRKDNTFRRNVKYVAIVATIYHIYMPPK